MKKINVDRAIYFFALFLLVAANLLCNVKSCMNYLIYVKFLSYFIFTINGTTTLIKKSKIKVNKFFIIIISLVIGFTTYAITKNTLLLDLFFVIYASSNKKFEEILKGDLVIKFVITTIILLAYFSGKTITRFEVTRDNEYIRNAFGFYHPNTFGMYIMMIYFEIMALSKKINLKNILLGMLSIVIIYYTSNSRTAYFTIGIFLIFGLIMLSLKLFKKDDVKLYNLKLNKYLFLILTFISMAVTYLYGIKSHFVLKLNDLFSGRISLQYINMQKFPVTLFGNNIMFYRTLDNGFLKLLLNYGIISVIIYWGIFYLNFRKLMRNKDDVMTIILFALLYFTISESTMLYIYYNIFLLYFFCKQEDSKV